MPPILENSEHRYSRYTFQLAAYGCKSAAMVSCSHSRRAWRARASQTVFRSQGTQAVVMTWLGSKSRHISVQWCKNKSGSLEWLGMQSITWLLSPMNRMSAVGRVLRRSAASRRGNASDGGGCQKGRRVGGGGCRGGAIARRRPGWWQQSDGVRGALPRYPAQ